MNTSQVLNLIDYTADWMNNRNAPLYFTVVLQLLTVIYQHSTDKEWAMGRYIKPVKEKKKRENMKNRKIVIR